MVRVRPGATRQVVAITAGVIVPAGLNAAIFKGKRAKVPVIGSVNIAAGLGMGLGGVCTYAGVTEQGVRGQEAEDLTNFGTACFVTGATIEIFDRIRIKQKQASLPPAQAGFAGGNLLENEIVLGGAAGLDSLAYPYQTNPDDVKVF